jgi:hypothetical protein
MTELVGGSALSFAGRRALKSELCVKNQTREKHYFRRNYSDEKIPLPAALPFDGSGSAGRLRR